MAKSRKKSENEHKVSDNDSLIHFTTFEPDPAQEKAITHKEGPLLIVAGAGTGKTRVITERIARLISDKAAEPSQILALTFSEKAAREMEKRVDTLVPYGMIETRISTFHSFGHDIIDDNFAELKIAPDWKVLKKPDAIIFMVENIEKLGLEIYRPLNNPAQYLSQLFDFISKLKDNLITPEIYEKYAASITAETGSAEDEIRLQHAELARFYSKYERLKTDKNFMDFGDLITVPYRLLKEKKSVAEKYRKKFRYILIDEFQDTNYAQFELIKLIADGHRNITVVGDDDQMIYKFRGAAISNIMGFTEYYKDAGVVVLKNNYRSHQEILDAAHKVIQNNNDRLESRMDIVKKLESKYKTKLKPPHVRVKLFSNYSEEADFAASEIEKRIKEGSANLSDFAVLVRSKNDAKIFLATFENRGISYRFTGDEGLFNKKEVQFLINFCASLASPFEFNPLFDVAVSEVYSVDPFVMSKIGARSRDYQISAFDLIREIHKYPEIEAHDKDMKGLQALIKDIEYYTGLIAQGWRAGEVLYDYVKAKRIFENLLRQNTPEAGRVIANIAKFFEILKQFSINEEYDTVVNFTRYIELKRKSGDNPQAELLESLDEECVQVATIHKAKGLEYRFVFVIGLIQDKFPMKKMGGPGFPLPEAIMHDLVDEETYRVEEERRLFYVAMTRAKDTLYLTASKQYDGAANKKISIFLKELGVEEPELAAQSENVLERLSFFQRKKGVIEALTAPVKPGPLILSNYQIDDYLTCPFKYKLIHILRMPIREVPNIIYGQAMHKVAAEYYKAKMEGRHIELEALLKIFESMWRPAGFISREHERRRFEKGVENIKRFYEQEEEAGIVPVFIEKDFQFKINDRVSVRGRWDRIDEREGKRVILDYKTSEVQDEEKAKKKISSADISRQLTLYALAHEMCFDMPVESVGVYFFESGITAVKKLRKDTTEKFKEKILETASDIMEGKFAPSPSSFTCSQCAFFDICPASKAEVLF